jgi:hypothetical protein
VDGSSVTGSSVYDGVEVDGVDMVTVVVFCVVDVVSSSEEPLEQTNF